MDDHDELIDRLRDLGRQRVEPSVQSAHLTAMASARPARSRSKLRVAGAFLAGLIVGGSGLAVAGALPDAAQNAAHDAFEQVGVQVPQPERHHDDAVCGPEVQKNHGGYVRNDKALARTDCGKPIGAGTDADEGADDSGEGGKGAGGKGAGGKGAGGKGAGGKGPGSAEGGQCEGPPPWAGNKSMTAEAKVAAQRAWAAECGTDGSVDDAETEASQRGTTTTAVTTTP
jgi:hypothetical protein